MNTSFQDVSFIKIDVEGHELSVLEGGVRTIANNRPVLWVEIEQRHLSRPMSDVFEFIKSLGYDGGFYDGTFQPLEKFRYEIHQVA
jgi:hypothetical protein